MSDMFTQFATLLEDDGVTLKDDLQVHKNFSTFMVGWGNMMSRKITAE